MSLGLEDKLSEAIQIEVKKKADDQGIVGISPSTNSEGNGTTIEVSRDPKVHTLVPESISKVKSSNMEEILNESLVNRPLDEEDEDLVIVEEAVVLAHDDINTSAEDDNVGGGGGGGNGGNEDSGTPGTSFMYSASLNILKFAASVAPRNVGMMRLVTDHSIPSILLPSGIHLQKKVVMIPSCQIHPDLTGEVYTHKLTEKRVAEASLESSARTTSLGASDSSNSTQVSSPTETETAATVSAATAATTSGRVIKPERRLKPHFGITVLYAHGGAYCLCSTGTHRRLLALLCLKSTARIVAVNYRRPPEHPHACCVLDIVRAYLELLSSGTPPESIILAGDSAGGGLCVSALLALRDAKRPLPAGAALMSPWVDLSEFSGGTWGLNHKTDFLAHDLAELFAKAVVGETGDAKDPSISPVYADLTGLPPLCVEAGGSEVLLSQISRFVGQATLAGVSTEFKASPGMVHVFQLFDGMGLKEPGESLDRISSFIRRVSVISIGSPYGFTIRNSSKGLKHHPKPLGKLERSGKSNSSRNDVENVNNDYPPSSEVNNDDDNFAAVLPPPLSYYEEKPTTDGV